MELDGGEAGDPEHTVTRVRAPRQAVSTASDTVQSVKGSTRLEAKRQRRRDSRSGGRRRTVITEAEFLARREAVDRKMLVRQRDQRIQIAVLEDGVLAEHFVSHTTQDSMIGNVYLGKVQNVLPSMEAAFVDIGRGRNAVLYAGEVNWDAAQLDGKPRKIENALKSGDTVLVQVTKDPVGHKGARLTSQVSLPGRYLVYVPGGSMTGISRKLPDVERSRLKKILKDHLPQDAGVIVRTAAEGTSEQELQNDINRLRAQWEGIQEKASGTKVLAPELLYAEPDLTIKTVRDVFNEDFSAMLVQGEATWDNIEAYVTYVAPHLLDRLHHWVPEDHDGEDLYATHRVDEQLHKALERKVYLPSGGSLVIDRTEAMTVVDVNTGKFTGSGGNLEETVTKNNLEAAEEIVRQLRLRDIGGIIVIDFIDMVLEANRDLVLRRLVECLGRDRTKHQVAEVTSLGLVQMTRKRMGTGLVEVFSETCEHCAGRGIIIKDTPVERGRSGGEQRGEAEGRRRRRRRGDGEGEHAHAAAATTTGAEPTDSEDERQRRERAEAARVALHSIAKASGKVAEDETPAQEPAPAEQAADAAEDSAAEAVEAASAGPAEAGQPAGADEEETPRRRRRRGRRRGRGRTEESADTGAEAAGSEDAARSHDDGPAESAGQTRQIDENVDLLRSDQFGRAVVRKLVGIQEFVERSSDAPPHVGAVVGRNRDCGGVEAGPVMAFKQPGRELGNRMLAKIRRQVADVKLVPLKRRVGRLRIRVARRLAGRPLPRAAKLVVGLLGDVEEDEGLATGDRAAGRLDQTRPLDVVVAPVADRGPGEKPHAGDVFHRRVEHQGPLVGGGRFLEALQLKQGVSHVGEGFGIARVEADRLLEIRNGLVVLLQIVEHRAAVVPALRDVGIE